ncbi:hypothetical protein [Moorena producens]|nr:hypothetical protein [Moorena producens]
MTIKYLLDENVDHIYSNYHSYEVDNLWILGNREQGVEFRI